MATGGAVPEAMAEAFESQGFCIIPNVLTPAEAAQG